MLDCEGIKSVRQTIVYTAAGTAGNGNCGI